MKSISHSAKIILFFASSIFLLSSCSSDDDPPPSTIASFKYTVLDATVAFINTSSNATTFQWDFGDGNTSTLTSPTHTYNATGTYLVTLTAFGAGTFNSTSKNVSVIVPNISVTFTNSVFTDIEITLNNITQTISPGGSVIFDNLNDYSEVSYSAYTYGKTTGGTQVGEFIQWSNTLDLTNGSRSIELIINSVYFFLYIRNNGLYDINTVYVNFGYTEQTVDYVFIENDNKTYRIGYYRAASNSNVRLYYQYSSVSYSWYQGTQFFLPWTNNQSITLVNYY